MAKVIGNYLICNLFALSSPNYKINRLQPQFRHFAVKPDIKYVNVINSMHSTLQVYNVASCLPIPVVITFSLWLSSFKASFNIAFAKKRIHSKGARSSCSARRQDGQIEVPAHWIWRVLYRLNGLLFRPSGSS